MDSKNNKITNEVWLPVTEYPYSLYYEVSNMGRVKSYHYSKPQIMGLNFNKQRGYYYVTLSADGSHGEFLVHRLVALAFIPNNSNDELVNHKNENKRDNRVVNLEWCDKQYNNTYGTALQRKSNTVKYISPPKDAIPIRIVDSNGNTCTVNSINQAVELTGTSQGAIILRCEREDAPNVNGYSFSYAKADKKTSNDMWNFTPSIRNYRKTKEEEQDEISKTSPFLKITGVYINVTTDTEFTCSKCGTVFIEKPCHITTSNAGCPNCMMSDRLSIARSHEQDLLDGQFPYHVEVGKDFTSSENKCSITCSRCGKTSYTKTKSIKQSSGRFGCPNCNRKLATTIRNLRRYGHSEEEIAQTIEKALETPCII